MAKLMAVIKREYLERVRTKWFIISTLFGPIFFLGIAVLPGLLTVRGMQRAQVTNFRILDATGVALGERVATVLKDRAARNALRGLPGAAADTTPIVAPSIVTLTQDGLAAAESTATRAVMAEETRGYLVLDSATMSPAARARYAGRNASSIGEMEQVEAAVRSALLNHRLQAAGISGARADSLTRVRADVTTERITSKGRSGSGSGLASAIFGFFIAILLYMMIVLYGQNIMRGVLEEKMSRVAEVVIASVSPDTLLAGKVIGVGAVGLTQQLVWLAFGVGISLFGMNMAAASGIPAIAFPQVSALQMVTLVLYFLLGYTFYAALFAAVGAMCSTQEEANQAMQPVVMLLVASIIFVQPIVTQPTGTMATTMSLLPFSSPIIMPLIMSATQVPTWQVVASLVGLLLSCLASIWLSARIYRVGLLMTGKRPSIKELVRWVRYA